MSTLIVAPLQQGLLDLTRLWLRSLKVDALLASIPGALTLLWIGHTDVVAALQAVADAFQIPDPQGRSALGVLAARVELPDVIAMAFCLLITLACHTAIIRRQWRQLDSTGLLCVEAGLPAGARALLSTVVASLLYLALCFLSFSPTPWVMLDLASMQIPLLMKVLAALLFLSVAAIPTIWLSITLLPMPYLAALQGTSPIHLLPRSARLMRGHWWISSLYTSIPGTIYGSILLLIPFVVLIVSFWWLGGLRVDGPELDHLHWLTTTITASRWLLWPMDALLLPMIHASCLVALRQALPSQRIPPRPTTPLPTSPI